MLGNISRQLKYNAHDYFEITQILCSNRFETTRMVIMLNLFRGQFLMQFKGLRRLAEIFLDRRHSTFMQSKIDFDDVDTWNEQSLENNWMFLFIYSALICLMENEQNMKAYLLKNHNGSLFAHVP